MLDLLCGTRLLGWGSWGLEVGRLRMMSMSMLKHDALVFGPRLWRPELRKVQHRSNIRDTKLKMKFVQYCCVAEAAASKERSNVAKSAGNTGMGGRVRWRLTTKSLTSA